MLFVLSVLAPHVNHSFWERVASLLCAIAAAAISSRIISPLSPSTQLTAVMLSFFFVGGQCTIYGGG
jgi:hypothetical protein